MCMQIYLVQSVCMCFWPQLSCQMVELFEACQQQSSDLARKEMCRTRLQQDIQRIYAGLTRMQCHSALAFCCDYYHLSVFPTVARLYLNGSSMNGLGCRSSDADLCLVLKGKVSVSDFTPRMSCKMCVCSHRCPHDLKTLVFVSEKTRSYLCALCPPKVVQNTV